MNYVLRSIFLGISMIVAASACGADLSSVPGGWTIASPREEIKPLFAYKADGGVGGQGALVIRTDHREGLDGFWVKSFPVVGGKHYRFEAFYRSINVPVPRRSVVVRLLWQDAAGRQVPSEEPVVAGYLRRIRSQRRSDCPGQGVGHRGRGGSEPEQADDVELPGRLRRPSAATSASG